jgi:hypothetical protein
MSEAGKSGTDLLTGHQIRYLENLPDDHELVGILEGVPTVRRRDGQLIHMSPSGQLMTTAMGVESAQSYLDVYG